MAHPFRQALARLAGLALLAAGAPLAQAQTEVSGTITENTRWTRAGSPYILVDAIIIQAGATLTIAPGVEVRLSNRCDIYVYGALTAYGTVTRLIRFVGPEAREGTIRFMQGSSGTLDHVVIERLGHSFATGWEGNNALTILSSDVAVTNAAVLDSRSYGIWIGEGAAPVLDAVEVNGSANVGITVANGSPTITGCTISGHGQFGIDVHYTSSTDPNVPVLAGTAFSGNDVDLRAPLFSFGGLSADNAIGTVEAISTVITSGDAITLPYIAHPYTLEVGSDVAVVVESGATLAIEPGVEVEMASRQDFYVYGTLTAEGTAAAPIRFIGPEAREGTIRFMPGSVGTLDHVVIERLGYSFATGEDGNRALTIRSSGVAVTNSAVLDSRSVGIWVGDGADPSLSGCNIAGSGSVGVAVHSGSPTITGSAISGHAQFGISVLNTSSTDPSVLTLAGTYFSDNGIDLRAPVHSFTGVAEDNTLSTVEVTHSTIVAGDARTLPYIGAPYTLEIGSDVAVVVESGATLAIEPGVEVEMASRQDFYVYGTLTAEGTAAAPIRFIGPEAREGTIRFMPGSVGTLDHVVIERLGYSFATGEDGNRALTIRSSDVTVTNTAILDSRTYAVWVDDGARPTLTQCNIMGSGSHGLYNDGNAEVDAENTWWGDASGPYHPTLNPNGQGDQVSDNVDFIPWRTSPVQIQNPCALTAAASTDGFLRFPLQDHSHSDRLINSILDHDIPTEPPFFGVLDPRAKNGRIAAFSGEQADRTFGVHPAPGNFDLYRGEGRISFSLFEMYTGWAGFDYLSYDGHGGIDYRGTEGQTVIVAAAAGELTNVPGSDYNTMIIDHGNGYRTLYLHAEERFRADGPVPLGTPIGYVGDVGAPGSPHLHFEVEKFVAGEWVEVDPYGWHGDYPDPYEAIRGVANANLWTDWAPPGYSIEVEPAGGEPVEIPASGGSFDYTVRVKNRTQCTLPLTSLTEATQPGGNTLGPILGPITRTLNPGGVLRVLLRQFVPGQAPSGSYHYSAEGTASSGANRGGLFFDKLLPFRNEEGRSERGRPAGAALPPPEAFAFAAADWRLVELDRLEPDANPTLTSDLDYAPSTAAHTEAKGLPAVSALHTARPNPFDATTVFGYDVSDAGRVEIIVYDVLGREVVRLVDGLREPGRYQTALDASRLPSGHYVVRMSAGPFVQTRRVTLLR